MLNAKTVTGALGATTLVLSAVPVGHAALDASTGDASGVDAAYAEEAVQAAASEVVMVSNVQGEFAWDQGVNASNAVLRRVLYDGSSKYICGVHDALQDAAAWVDADAASDEAASADGVTTIRVGGHVERAFTADIAAYGESDPVKSTISCTCAGNPADGRASANAEVEGFMLSALIRDANPAEDANAITFTSADGYSVSMPLSYVTQRQCIIVTAVNGEDASEAIGCSNQLWLGAVSARMFVQDVVAIDITHEDVVPAAPGAQGANLPNVGVVEGEAA